MTLCPVCSSELDSEARLVRCRGCIWADREAAREARCRLGLLRKGIGEHAYAADGCAVCRRCRSHFQLRSSLCPLVLFYNRSPRVPDEDAAEPERFPAQAEEYWDAYLRIHDYSEHVEAYWRRLTQQIRERTAGAG